jgi:hypothetical protein
VVLEDRPRVVFRLVLRLGFRCAFVHSVALWESG